MATSVFPHGRPTTRNVIRVVGRTTLRLCLAALLLVVGAWVVVQIQANEPLPGRQFPILMFLVTHVVVLIHVAGSMMVAFGVLVRLALLIQIPGFALAVALGTLSSETMGLSAHYSLLAVTGVLMLVLGRIDSVPMLPQRSDF